MNSGDPPGLYVHVPFCHTKCPYCDFYSVASQSLIPSWLEAIQREISLYRDKFGGFDSLYLGGGTPSVLSVMQLRTLFRHIRKYFSFSQDAEITIEVNPDDINPPMMAELIELGVNRFSVGIQSFNEKDLKFLKRRHSAAQTRKALDCIRMEGIDNLSIDLMYGLPGQTIDDWMENLESVLLYEPEHLSCYQLNLVEGTPFGDMKAEGRLVALREAAECDFFLRTSHFLEQHGYVHYEVSNYSKGPSFQSRHNLKYWHHVPYLGLGPSAHSFLGNTRWWNFRSIQQYLEFLEGGSAPIEGQESLSPEQLNLESIFLGLRTTAGIDHDTLTMNPSLKAVLTGLEASRHIRIRNGKITPTRKGLLIADALPLLLTC